MNKVLKERIEILNNMAVDIGLDYYPINYEVVPQEVMLEVMSYGLPTRARHWSYGQSYEYQKMQGEMGHSKVYELVLNNDPSYAFLLDTNPDIANTMVAAHVIGHVHFFKHNFLFKQTDNKMVYHAAERAQRIEEYIQQYGPDAVERCMDIGFALDKHIDWHKGVYRNKYSKQKSSSKKTGFDSFDDILGASSNTSDTQPAEGRFPPHDEFDLIWFFTNYSKALEPWQKDVLETIRKESYYFYPQYMTKIMNEGFASFIHAELMMESDFIPEAEHLEFCKIHERVVQPGRNKLNINPYFLGFTIFNDIRKKWDEKKENGESDINGIEKIYQIVKDEDDISFLRNYLTEEIIQDLKLFVYKKIKTPTGDDAIEIVSKDLDKVIESLTSDLYNYRSPLICINGIEDGFLQLKHVSTNIGTLDPGYLEKTMEYIYEIWGGPLNLCTMDDKYKTLHYTYDELGFSE